MSALQSASDDDADGYYLQLATIAASSVRHMERISEVQPSVSSSLQQHAVPNRVANEVNEVFRRNKAMFIPHMQMFSYVRSQMISRFGQAHVEELDAQAKRKAFECEEAFIASELAGANNNDDDGDDDDGDDDGSRPNDDESSAVSTPEPPRRGSASGGRKRKGRQQASKSGGGLPIGDESSGEEGDDDGSIASDSSSIIRRGEMDALLSEERELVDFVTQRLHIDGVVMVDFRLADVTLCGLVSALDPRNSHLSRVESIVKGIAILLQNVERRKKELALLSIAFAEQDLVRARDYLESILNYLPSSSYASILCRMERAKKKVAEANARQEETSMVAVPLDVKSSASQLKAAAHRFKEGEECGEDFDDNVTQADVKEMTDFLHVHQWLQNLLNNALSIGIMTTFDSILSMAELYHQLNDRFIGRARELADRMNVPFAPETKVADFKSRVLLAAFHKAAREEDWELEEKALVVANDMRSKTTDTQESSRDGPGRREKIHNALMRSQSKNLDGSEGQSNDTSDDDYCTVGDKQYERRRAMVCLQYSIHLEAPIKRRLQREGIRFPQGFVHCLLLNAPSTRLRNCDFQNNIDDMAALVQKAKKLKQYSVQETTIVVDCQLHADALEDLMGGAMD